MFLYFISMWFSPVPIVILSSLFITLFKIFKNLIGIIKELSSFSSFSVVNKYLINLCPSVETSVIFCYVMLIYIPQKAGFKSSLLTA